MSFVLYLVALAGLIIAAVSMPASAQTPVAPKPETVLSQPAEPTPPEWVVTCAPTADPNKTTCQMAQARYEPETGQPLVSAVIRPQAEDRHMGMLLSLPHGVYFPPGLSIRVDHGDSTDVAIQTSDAKGVYAALPLSDELITAMKLGKTLNIAMRFADGRDVVVPLTLEGFTAAYEKLTSLL